MPRIAKEQAYSEKRNEILSAAQRLVYSKGYEQITIQDILDDMKISKGAFYHYFDSKQDLLEALIQRMAEDAAQLLLPVVQDPHLPALEKLQRYFNTAARWKTERKAYLLTLMRAWYTDDNTIVRQKVQDVLIRQTAPLLASIIQQGTGEGIMKTSFPEQTGEMILFLFQSFGNTFVDLLFAPQLSMADLQRAEKMVAAYTEAIERLLGAPAGSLHLLDAQTLKEWLELPRNGN